MRRLLFCVALLAATLPCAVFATASIIGSGHDFTNASWNVPGAGGTNEVCKPCHIPHHAFENGTLAQRYAPLWNHGLDLTTTFNPYSSPTGTFLGTYTNGGQPNGVSLLCLSCHDGVIALDQFGIVQNAPGVTNTNTVTATPPKWYDPSSTGTKLNDAANLGADLSLTHPFSFIYDANLAINDPTLYNPTTTLANLVSNVPTYGGTIATDMLMPRGAGTTLECVSCHEPHNRANTTYALLIKDNTGGALCLTCHNK